MYSAKVDGLRVDGVSVGKISVKEASQRTDDGCRYKRAKAMLSINLFVDMMKF